MGKAPARGRGAVGVPSSGAPPPAELGGQAGGHPEAGEDEDRQIPEAGIDGGAAAQRDRPR